MSNTLDLKLESEDYAIVPVFGRGGPAGHFKSQITNPQPIRIVSKGDEYFPQSYYDDVCTLIRALESAGKEDVKKILPEEEFDEITNLSFQLVNPPEQISIRAEKAKGVIIDFSGEKLRFVNGKTYYPALERLKEIYKEKTSGGVIIETVSKEGEVETTYTVPPTPFDKGGSEQTMLPEPGLAIEEVRECIGYDKVIGMIAYTLDKCIYEPWIEAFRKNEKEIIKPDVVAILIKEGKRMMQEYRATYTGKKELESDEKAIDHYVKERLEKMLEDAVNQEVTQGKIDEEIARRIKSDRAVRKLYNIILERDRSVDGNSKRIIEQFFDPFFKYIIESISKNGKVFSAGEEIRRISGLKDVEDFFSKMYEIARGKERIPLYSEGKMEFERIKTKMPDYVFGAKLSEADIDEIIKALIRLNVKALSHLGET